MKRASIIDDFLLGETIAISDRGQDLILSGLFANGTRFSFDLNSVNSSDDFFASGSTLTITQVPAVPEPGCGLTLATMSILLLVRRRRALR